jgi:monoamine oxidase
MLNPLPIEIFNKVKLMAQNHEVPVYDVVIVGGGIAGMYCALRLAQKQQTVALFEKSDRWGGRIETVLMGKGQEFKAEFGPMRYEEKRQKSLKNLLDELKLEYAPFPPYQSSQPKWPDYNILDPEEQRWQDNPLHLLQMGILKVLGLYQNGMSKAEMDEEVAKFEQQNPASAPEYDFDILRRTARQGGKANGELLYTRGFWNALSDVLSHRAVLKIRDLGNFYHLIAENPNAIEWIIFWLNGFQPHDRLVGIKGGSAQLTKELLKHLDKFENFTRFNQHRLRGMRSGGELVRLYFDGEIEEVLARRTILALPKQPLLRLSPYLPETVQTALDSVIEIPLLKLFFVTDTPWWDEDTPPQTGAYTLPTREMHYYQEHCLQLSQPRQLEYRAELDRQLVSAAMRDEFLEAGIELPTDLTIEQKKNNTGWIVYYTPAAKIHKYFIRREDMSVFNKNGKGMVMIYTDRPASEYWKDYILAPHDHERAEIRGDLRLVDRFFKYLAHSFEMEQQDIEASASQILPNWERFQSQSTQKIVEELKGTIEDFGIHDWGKEPYHGACHVWKPNAKSWEVMVRLRAFSLINDPEKHKNIHICGEAYSDYQGFIEGALRSAQGVLDWIETHQESQGRSLQPDFPGSEPISS